MSIQSKFRKKGLATNKKKTVKDLVASNDQTESVEYLTNFQQLKEVYYPPADYTNLDNISRYGSTRGVYELAIVKIYEEYPYDGTLAEKSDWEFKNSFLERHIFENEYPRYNGHISLSANGWGTRTGGSPLYGESNSLEYIEFKGGPHSTLTNFNHIQTTDSFGRSSRGNRFSLEADSLSFDSMRQSNLYSSGTLGNTVEFWFKKSTFDVVTQTPREVIFDMWNQKTDVDYGRFRIEYSEINNHPVFYLTYVGPSNNDSDRATALSRGVIDCPLDYVNARTVDHDDPPSVGFYSDWHHLAFSVQNKGSDLEIRLHVDGELVELRTAIGQSVATIPTPHIAQLGALMTAHEMELDVVDSSPFAVSGAVDTVITFVGFEGDWGTMLGIEGEILRISDGTNTVDYTYSQNCVSDTFVPCDTTPACDAATDFCTDNNTLRYGVSGDGLSNWTCIQAANELVAKVNANNNLNITAVRVNNTVVLTPDLGATITVTEDPSGNGQIGNAEYLTVAAGALDENVGIFGTFAISDTSKVEWITPEQKRENSLGLEADASTSASPVIRKTVDSNALYVDAVLINAITSNELQRKEKIDFSQQSFPNLTPGEAYKMVFEVKNQLGVVLRKIESEAYTF